ATARVDRRARLGRGRRGRAWTGAAAPRDAHVPGPAYRGQRRARRARPLPRRRLDLPAAGRAPRDPLLSLAPGPAPEGGEATLGRVLAVSTRTAAVHVRLERQGAAGDVAATATGGRRGGAQPARAQRAPAHRRAPGRRGGAMSAPLAQATGPQRLLAVRPAPPPPPAQPPPP